MSFSLPIPVADFWDLIPLEQGSTFEPDEAMEVNRTGGGAILSSSSGDRLWTGQVTFGAANVLERREAASVLNALRQPGFPFLCYDRKRPAPLSDPDGSILNGFSPTTTTSEMSTVNLTGFPAGFTLHAGDLFGYTIGTDPIRHYVHEVGQTAVADASGNFTDVPITPFAPEPIAGGIAIELFKPLMTAVYNPGSFASGRGQSGGFEKGRTFSFIQTLEY